MKEILTGVLFLTLLSCTRSVPPEKTSDINAFYYWQTSLKDFPSDNELVTSLPVHKVYYRFFDVDWDERTNMAVPVSPLRSDYRTLWKSASVVPVIFITNETLLRISDDEVETLAGNIHRKVMNKLLVLLMENYSYDVSGETWWQQDPYRFKSRKFDEQARYDSVYQSSIKLISEIQFDCDWTAKTRNKYFQFLTASKRLFKDQLLTSTLRLHQFKYRTESGIPPVDRVMLMCYNTGDVKNKNIENSIFDKREVMSYLKNMDYPLPVDYALPLFRWGLLFQNGKLKKILDMSFLEQYGNVIEKGAGNMLFAREDFVYGYDVNSVFIRKGDEIKVEEPNMKDVIELCNFLAVNRNDAGSILTLYHLSNEHLSNHADAIRTLFDIF
jgi:hypothetical protein